MLPSDQALHPNTREKRFSNSIIIYNIPQEIQVLTGLVAYYLTL